MMVQPVLNKGILSVFVFKSSSLKRCAIGCCISKQKGGWDFKCQCSVISLKAVKEWFVVHVEVMCHVFGSKGHVQASMSLLTSGEWGSVGEVV